MMFSFCHFIMALMGLGGGGGVQEKSMSFIKFGGVSMWEEACQFNGWFY